jgi:DNA-directed RNA polymerase specialized sigma subunit
VKRDEWEAFLADQLSATDPLDEMDECDEIGEYLSREIAGRIADRKASALVRAVSEHGAALVAEHLGISESRVHRIRERGLRVLAKAAADVGMARNGGEVPGGEHVRWNIRK